MSKSIQSRKLASSQIPEWRRTAAPSDASRSSRNFARRPKLKGQAKSEEDWGDRVPVGLQQRNGSLRRSRSTLETSLESLGFDIWFLISSYIPKSVLVSVCLTSQLLNSNIIPVLYHTIDLSIHAPPDGITFSFNYRRKTCECQYLFLRLILQKPTYGQYIRSLKWTVGLENEKLAFRPGFLQGERVVWKPGDVEKLFECLDQVVTLDIESATRDGGKIFEGKEFFPAAQCVNLRGTSHASSILYGTSKAHLSTLHLGPYRITRPDPSHLTHAANRPSSSSSIPDQPDQTPKYPSLLNPSFRLRCKNLHTLSFTLQLSDTRSEVRDFYTSLAVFLTDICPRCFIFKLVGMNGQAIPQPSFRHRGDKLGTTRRQLKAGRGRNTQWSHVSSITQANIVPENFRDILLPVLIRGWEGLQRIEIRGVMWSLLADLRRELMGKGVVISGDGWEFEVDEDEDWVEFGGGSLTSLEHPGLETRESVD